MNACSTSAARSTSTGVFAEEDARVPEGGLDVRGISLDETEGTKHEHRVPGVAVAGLVAHL